MLADSFSSLRILLMQFSFSPSIFYAIRFKGMQLCLRIKSCFHSAQSIFFSIWSTNLLNFLPWSQIYDFSQRSVQNALSMPFNAFDVLLVQVGCSFISFLIYYLQLTYNLLLSSQALTFYIFEQSQYKIQNTIRPNIAVIYYLIHSEGENNRMQKATLNKYHGKKKLLFNSEEVWKKSSQIKKSPSAIFGKSQKSSPDKQIKPGPGSYDVNKTFLDKGLISFKGAKRIRCQTESPAPLAYNNQKKRYNPHFLSLSKPLVSQKAHIHTKTYNSPSPASYQISRTVKVLSHSFSRKKRQFLQDKEKQKIPGPAQYEIDRKQRPKLQFSFSHARKFKETEKESAQQKSMPGPGAYDLSRKRQHVKCYKFTTALRNFSHFQQHPGPSYYSPQKSELEHIGGVISKELRKFQYENNVPGPGAYDQVSIDTIKLKEPRPIIPKSGQSRIQVNPQVGPGYYFQNEQKAKVIGGVIGREKRNSTTVELMPGPLTYQPHYYELLSRTVSTVIGRQKRMKDCLINTPGPGQYQNDKNQKFFSSSKWRRGSQDRRFNFTQILKQKVQVQQRFENYTASSHK